MSVFIPEIIECPYCGHSTERSVAVSLNATRAPRYREAILKGEFQKYNCSQCSMDYHVERPFVYFDYDTGDWIGVFPLTEEPTWPEYEQAIGNALDRAFGPAAPPAAQSLGSQRKLRTVFGMLALREKIVCQQAGMNDGLVELLKIHLMEPAFDRLVLGELNRPRLIEVSGDRLIFLVPAKIAGQANGESFRLQAVDRKAYQELLVNSQDLNLFLVALQTGSYVDIGRMFQQAKELSRYCQVSEAIKRKLCDTESRTS